jgi:hypothetical protein
MSTRGNQNSERMTLVVPVVFLVLSGHRSLRPVPGADRRRLAGAMRADLKEGHRMRGYAYLTAALAALAA